MFPAALCFLPSWVATQQGAPETSLTRHFHQLLWGNSKAFPGQQSDLISTAFPRFALGSPPRWTCLKHLPREASRSYPIQMPSRLHWLLSMQRSTSSNLSSSRRSELLVPSLRLSTHFTFLSFPSLPQGHDHSWWLEHRLTGQQSLAHFLIHCISLIKTTQVLLSSLLSIHFPINATKNYQSLRFCTSNEICIFVLCKQTLETLLPAAQMWVRRVETHQHSGQFPMLSYPAMCTGAAIQARAGEAPYFIT